MNRQLDNAVHNYYEHIEHAINVSSSDSVCIGSDCDRRRPILTGECLDKWKCKEGENLDPAMWLLYFEKLNGSPGLRRTRCANSGMSAVRNDFSVCPSWLRASLFCFCPTPTCKRL